MNKLEKQINPEVEQVLRELYDAFEDCETNPKGTNDPTDLVASFSIIGDEWIRICKKHGVRL